MPIAYITIGTNDMVRSRRYYDAVMPHLGGRLEVEYGDQACCYAMPSEQRVWIGKPNDGLAAAPGNGSCRVFCAKAKRRWTRPMPRRWRMGAPTKAIPVRVHFMGRTSMAPMPATPKATR